MIPVYVVSITTGHPKQEIPMKPYGLKLGGNPGCNCGRCRRGWREGATQNTICKSSARQEAKRIMASWQSDYAVDCKSA